MTARRGGTWLALATLLFAAAGCGSKEATDSKPAATAISSSAPSSSTASTPVGELPEPFRITAPSIDGSTIALSDYADKPVALWFWAPG